MRRHHRYFVATTGILLATLTVTGSVTATGNRPPPRYQYSVDVDGQEVLVERNHVAEAPNTPGSSGGFCASNGAGAQGIKGGVSLFLVDQYCHIRQSRLDAERSCWDHPNMPDPSGRVTKSGAIFHKPNPQCGRIDHLLMMEDATLHAYVGVNNWKAWLRARLFGFLAWLV